MVVGSPLVAESVEESLVESVEGGESGERVPCFFNGEN